MPCLAQVNDGFAPKPEVPDGFVLVGGDILVRVVKVPGPPSAFPNDPNAYWANGIVPYEFDTNVSAANRNAILNAMMQWESVANVEFVVRNGQFDYVHIKNSTGNNSQVGRVGGGQIINIFNWDSTFIMAHELGHCLGYDHTQTRPDRAAFVTINYANIQSGRSNNFDVAVGFNGYGPYDFDSVMQYDQCAFSIDCPAGSTCACTNHTIDVLPTNATFWQSRIGQRDHLSAFDQLVMSFLYPEANWRFADRNFTGAPESGTFLRPFKTFATAKTGVPSGGTVWMQPGAYSAVGTHSKAMTLRAPLGGVTMSD